MDLDRLRALAVSDTGFVFDPRTGHSYSVNATAVAALAVIRAGGSLAEAADRLREQFDAGLEPVEDHLEAFLAFLRDLGLLGARRPAEVKS